MMESTSSELSPFLETLAGRYGAVDRRVWRNNNSTLIQSAYIIDLKDLRDHPAKILMELFKENQKNGDFPYIAVPVAGFEPVALPWYRRIFSCLTRVGRSQRLLEEYAQSFSLSPFTTALNADIVLRASQKAQKSMKVFKRGGEYFLKVPAGVRITDADRFLAKKKLALPPNMPTLHVASLIGAAANGSYGPGRDYGPMSTNIVEMKVINALGEPMTLSEEKNSDLFSVLRDCHMSSGCFVSEITLKNIERRFLMRRESVLYQGVKEFKEGMYAWDWIAKQHFIAMYIPVDDFPRIRVTTFERTDESPSHETRCNHYSNLTDYLNLSVSEIGEPLIGLVTTSKKLRKYFPFILKTAAMKTYGFEEETLEIGWSDEIVHVFRTYTDLPIYDINWLIQVEDTNEARELNIALLNLTDKRLKQYAKKEKYPLFNAFCRYLKGVSYPEGEGGVAPTAVDYKHQSIFSYELVTYGDLAQTKPFKNLVAKVVGYLEDNGYKFTYHPGKNWPDNTRSLTQIFNDEIGRQRLKNFKKAVYKLHGDKTNLPFSPLLTPQKRKLIGFDPMTDEELDLPSSKRCTPEMEGKALEAIMVLALDEDDQEMAEKVQDELTASKKSKKASRAS